MTIVWRLIRGEDDVLLRDDILIARLPKFARIQHWFDFFEITVSCSLMTIVWRLIRGEDDVLLRDDIIIARLPKFARIQHWFDF